MKNNELDKEPDWMNPANDRKTPYTDEEIDVFVEGFIIGLDDKEWADIKQKYGEEEARKRIRASMVDRDERNLNNLTPKGSIN
tara:strand:+ start:582 stop:830 length:249 start_codon:yes stop_codon:yes gene_type:complete